LQLIILQSALDFDQRFRILQLGNEKMDDVLAHPFLGRKYYLLLPNDVKNPYFAFSFTDLIVELRQIKLNHSVKYNT